MKDLKTRRKKINLKQKDMAELLNIDQTTYSNYETGKCEPSLETLIKLAKLFKCSIDELIGLEKKELEKIEFKTERFTEKQKEILQYVERLDEQQCKVAKIYFQALLDDFVEVEQTEEKEEKN